MRSLIALNTPCPACILLAMNAIEHRIASRLKHVRPSLRLAMLFGSVAEGREHFESDVDLGLLDNEPLDADTIIEIALDVGAEIGRPVDIVDVYGVPQPITGSVLQGKRLLGSDECFATLYTRHLIEREDFGRLRRRVMTERIDAWIG